MRPRCSILTGGFDFSGCGDCTSCPPIEQAEMSNSEPSAIVLQGIPCMCGLYKFRFEWRKRFAQGSPRFTLSRSRMRSRTGLASPVENQACGIAKYPRLRVHRHEVRMTLAKRRSIYRRGQTGSKGNWLRTQNAEAALSRMGFAGCASRARSRHWSVSVNHRFLRRGKFFPCRKLLHVL
jgi:hypothetical protein